MSSNSFRLDAWITGDGSVFHSRRLLLDRNPPSPVSQYPAGARAGDNSFDANVVMVLSVLLCALICSLGLNSIIRCAMRCSSLVGNSPDPNTSGASGPGNGGGGPGIVSNGIKKKALKMFPTVSYSLSDHASLPGLGSDCAICLSEFTSGEMVRLMPKCHHGFHVRCIDKWLNSHSSCPKCRHNLHETCQKIAGTGQSASSSEVFPVPPAIQEAQTVVNVPVLAVEEALTVVNIPALQHEGPVLSYSENI